MRLHWRLGKWTTLILVVGCLVKALLMTLSPMSVDLAYAISRTLTHATQGRTPYGVFIGAVIAFWGTLPVDHPSILTGWTVDFFQPSFGLYLLVFLLKLPLLVLDLLTGVLIYRISLNAGVSEHKAAVAFSLWFLNPYVMLTNEMWGSVEILPTFLLVLVYAFSRTRKGQIGAAFTYAAATAVKLFPVILLPIYPAVFRARRKLSLMFVLACALGVGTYFGWVSFAGYNPWFQLRQYNLFTQYFDEYVISTTGGIQVGLATIALILTYVLIAERWPRDERASFDGALLILLVFMAFTSWFPQSLIWLIPFLILDVAFGDRSIAYLIVLLSSAFFFDIVAFYPYFTANSSAFFFIPAKDYVTKSVVAAYETFAKADANVLFGGPFARALFSATCIVYSLKLIEKRTGLISTLQKLLFYGDVGGSG